MSKTRLHIMQVLMIILLSSLFVSCNEPHSTVSLFEEIEERYYGHWYKNIRFKLSVESYKNDTINSRATYEAEYVCPYQAIIKTDVTNKNGLLFLYDTVYRVTNGVILSKLEENSQFLWIGMNIFNLTTEENIQYLKSLDFVDIDKFCKHYEGEKAYYILGIPEYSEKYKFTNQMWFDAETLIPCRCVKDRFGNYYTLVYENFIQVFGTGWIPQKISYIVNDEIVTIQRIYDIYVPFEEKKSLSIDDFSDNETIYEKQMNARKELDINIVIDPY